MIHKYKSHQQNIKNFHDKHPTACSHRQGVLKVWSMFSIFITAQEARNIFVINPLSKPMLTHHQLDPTEPTSVNFLIKFFYSIKFTRKGHLQNVDHLVKVILNNDLLLGTVHHTTKC